MKKISLLQEGKIQYLESFQSESFEENLASLPLVKAPMLMMENLEPLSVTILPTYRCNAACKECCFESDPSIKHVMNRDQLLNLIKRVHIELPSVKLVVFSGGEVTLLGKDLIDALSLLAKFGIDTRIVSNGHWGRTDASARKWVNDLKGANLSELNLSTGDDHIEWVPLDSVATAAYNAVRVGLRTLIVVEGKDNSYLTVEKLKEHPLISEILNSEELRKEFILMSNIWMPFHKDTDISNNHVEKKYEGCDNIFDNYVVNPYGDIMSCCGLTMEYIPEIKVGNIAYDDLKKTYGNQFGDLLKLWIWLDGTRFIFERAVERGKLNVPLISPHVCSICAQIYKDPQLRYQVAELVRENADQIIFRATLKSSLGHLPAKELNNG